MKTPNWSLRGQVLVLALVVVSGLAVVGSLPNPAWEMDRQAEATMNLASGLEGHWSPSYLGSLSASDVEALGLSPRGWRRSGNGWQVGPNQEHFEVGTWKEASGRAGFALIFSNLDAARCKEMARLLGNAFDQFAVNDKGQQCAPEGNKLVFYRTPGA